MTRIETYCESWLATAEVKTYDDLKNLILREQCLNMCPRNLEIHLRERSFTSISEMCKQANRYFEARNQKMTTGIRAKQDDSIQDTDTKSEQKQQKNCYNCGKLGHTRAECRNKGGGNEQKCNHCDIYGHTEEACRNKKEFTGMMSTRSIQNRHHEKLRLSNQNKGRQRSKDQADFNQTLKLVPGKVNGYVVDTLRDTGCSTICVNKRLVAAKQLMGRYKICTLMDGAEKRFKTAIVDIDTP